MRVLASDVATLLAASSRPRQPDTTAEPLEELTWRLMAEPTVTFDESGLPDIDTVTAAVLASVLDGVTAEKLT